MCTDKIEIRTCLNCWKELLKYWKKFCSSHCKSAYRNKTLVERVCKNCWKKFIGRYRAIACSKECRDILRTKKYKENFTKKYWVDNPSKLKWSREKFKQTMMDRYWVEHPSQSEELLNRQKQLFVDKYWVDNPMKDKNIHSKWENTIDERFWWVAPILNKNVREKYEKTMVEKYWVTNPYLNDDIKNKAKKTMVEKYWVPYYCLTEECQKQTHIISKVNLWFNSRLQELWFLTKLEFPIENRSYDIKVWNTLIEINPFPYHNSTWNPLWEPKYQDYHYDKLKLARDNGYRCIMVWDWDDVEKVIYLLEDNKENIYARKCEVKQIEYNDCHQFFEDYHLQWDTAKNKNNIYVWLYYNDNLVECMSFWKPRYNKNYEREILRLCSHKDYKVIWWANKIFKHFLEISNATSVISYCDMSKFDWWVYEQLWFKLLKWNKPSKHWYNYKEIDSKKHITDNLLRQHWYDKIFWENYGKWTDNNDLMRQRGYVEIYDCWQSTFVWTKE